MARLTEFEIKQLKFLESIDIKMGKLLENTSIVPGTLKEIPGAATTMGPSNSESEIITVAGMEADWVLSGMEWDGKSEVADEAELTEFLGFNPNERTGGKPWCAGFWLKIFEKLGFDVSDLDLRAVSFANWGYDLLKLFTPETLPNGAILVFQPDPDADYPISHIGVKVDDDKLFGGNQGDKAKRSNLAFYMANAKLVAARCPDGYKLT